MAERFAREHIGEVYFDEGDTHCRDGIPQGDAGVGKRRRVDEDEIDAVVARLMDALD